MKVFSLDKHIQHNHQFLFKSVWYYQLALQPKNSLIYVFNCSIFEIYEEVILKITYFSIYGIDSKPYDKIFLLIFFYGIFFSIAIHR